MAFQKGQSGNPAGRPKGSTNEVMALARVHTAQAIQTLVDALSDARTCVPAAVALLDRGWGKPAQAITGADGGALHTMIEVVTGVPSKPETDETPDDERGFGKHDTD